MFQGYIGVTDPKWFEFNKQGNHKEVIFWRKSSEPVNLSRGDYFFFLIRGKLPRLIKGYGFVKNVSSDKILDIWNKFKKYSGCNTIEELELRIGKARNDKVAYYHLVDVVYFDQNIVITDGDIGFAKEIMAGKLIPAQETKNMLSLRQGKKGRQGVKR